MDTGSFIKGLNYRIILFIVIISSATALIFNYLNPAGITLIELSDSEASADSLSSNEIKFIQPINVNSEEANLLFTKGVKFIDVRSAAEYQEGHIPNSINLPIDFIDDAGSILNDYPKDTPFVVYGDNSNEAILNTTAQKMFELQFNRIYLFSGGYEEWSANNYEVSE